MRAWYRYALLLLTIIGGLHGLAISLRGFLSTEVPGVGVFVVFAAILIAYLYVIAAGLIYWFQPERIQPLFWAWAIQIPWISLPGIVYKFSVSLYIVVAFITKHHGDKYSAGVNGSFNLGSSWEFRLLQLTPFK
jgi:hypothetical protein